MDTSTRFTTLLKLTLTALFTGSFYSSPALTWAFDTYTGNGTNGNQIIGMSFQPDLVIIKGTGATPAFIRTSADAATQSKAMDVASGYATDAITSFVGTGFTLGTNAGVNTNGATYDFVAFEAGTDMVVGSYTGAGGFSQSVTGLGFKPAFVIIYSSSGSEVPVYTTTQMVSSGAAAFGSEQIWMNYINSLDADGFTLGSYLNTSGQVFRYAAFKATAGTLMTGSYSGTAGSQNISTTGMVPQYVIATNGSVFGTPAAKILVNAPAESIPFAAKASNTIDITGLNASSFTVAAGSADVNGTMNTNFYVAIGNGISSPLPVSWLYFHSSCMNDKTELNWATATETNCMNFSVERSTNGYYFQFIGQINGGGNSSEIRTYSFQDTEPNEGIVYYRIKETDYNGKFMYSSTIAQKSCLSTIATSLSLYPNPAENEVNAKVNLAQDELLQWKVISVSGKEIYSGELAGKKGENTFHIDLLNCPSGIYFLVINGQGSSVQQKLVKR
jgi:hypothetical protein